MELKTNEIVSIYSILKDAKLTKMESIDKFKVLKMMRVMRGVADEWESFIQNVDSKLQKENHEEIIEKAKKWHLEGENTSLTNEERVEINKYLIEFQKEKDACVKDELDNVIDLDFEKINESAFEKLIDSNDFEVNKILTLDLIVQK